VFDAIPSFVITLSIYTGACLVEVRDFAASVHRQGVRRVLLVNGHGDRQIAGRTAGAGADGGEARSIGEVQ
jgi:creatinine amidohydrolase/Fe(II)-dependent formamide hydrolase-like protein